MTETVVTSPSQSSPTPEQAVMAVQAVLEALKRKPGWLKDPRQSFFGALDLWFYLAISDDKTCWTCEMLNQGIYNGIDLRTLFPYLEIISANQMLPYVHPNCVLPDTVCESDEIVAGLSTWYDGPLFTISSPHGNNITVTPNHMFLTRNGFASAYLLRKGDEIVRDSCFQRKPKVHMNNDRRPTRIDEIVKSLSMPFGSQSVSVPVAAEDLHGDASFSKGNVDIVRSNGFLSNTVKSSLLKKLSAQNLSAYNANSSTLSGDGSLAQFLKVASFATDGGMSGTRKPSSFFTRRLTHSQKHAFTFASGSDASGLQPQDYTSPRDPELLAQCFDRHASFIDLDEVVSVDVKSFRGYLYDLQTLSTLYSGNGYIISNCRCTLLRVTDIYDYLDATEPSSDELNIF